MRYVWTIIWSLLIGLLVSYVLTSMAGETLALAPVFVISALFVITAVIIGDGILKEDAS